MGTNLDFSATDIKVTKSASSSASPAKEAAFTCDGKFVPMQ
jgi:hypothetical protein